MLKVYYSDIKDCVLDNNLIATLPEERREYVRLISNDKRKKQSLFVWKLLEKVLELNEISVSCFSRKADGEWFAKENEIKFSLSHSVNIVAVSISDSDVGIDVEECNKKLLKVKKMLLSKDNNENCTVELLARLWTEKESKYKAKINGIMSNITLFNDTSKYVLSVCGCESVNASQINKITL